MGNLDPENLLRGSYERLSLCQFGKMHLKILTREELCRVRQMSE